MTANSYLEYFLVLFGWVMNNAMWSILGSTGLFALPLVFKVIGIWLKVREEGADEGNKGLLALPRIEHAIYVSFLVMLFCCIPLLPVDISTIKFDTSRAAQCGVSVPSPQKSGYQGLVTDFDGRTAQVPVWWYLVHMMSKGTTQAMIASIPCGTQLRQIRFEVQNTRLRDPVLQQEVQDFADQCYSRAYFRLKNANSQLSDATINEVGWIGSSYFLNTSGYYDYYTAMTPRSQWPYDSTRDSGYPDIDPIAAGMAYIQLSLCGIPGEVVIGNSLSDERRRVLLTPAHYWGMWPARLCSRTEPDSAVNSEQHFAQAS